MKTEGWKNMEEEMQGAVVTGWGYMKVLWKIASVLIPILFIIFLVAAGVRLATLS